MDTNPHQSIEPNGVPPHALPRLAEIARVAAAVAGYALAAVPGFGWG
jgi:hypothetical protein